MSQARAYAAVFERSEHGIWDDSWGDVFRAGLAAAAGAVARFVDWTQHALAAARAQGSSFRRAQVQTELAHLASQAPDVQRAVPHLAEDLLRQAVEAAEGIAARYCEARAHLLLASVGTADAETRQHLEAALHLSAAHSYDGLWLQHERRRAAPLLARAASWGLSGVYVGSPCL